DRGAEHPPCFYSALVAPPGSGKTPIINSMVAPILQRAKDLLEEYKLQVAELKEEANKKGNDEVPIPPVEKPVVSSFTMEALYSCLVGTPRGILIYRDEIAAWINSMNQYKAKGDDKEFYLTAHNAQSYTVDRKNLDFPIFIERVMIGVLGGIQPGVLETFTDKNSQHSGFLARILFSWPDELEFRPYHDEVPDVDYQNRWNRIVKSLYDVTFDSFTVPPVLEEPARIVQKPRRIYLSGGAKELYAAYYDDLQERVHKTDNEVERSTLVKFRTHSLRIALSLHALEWATALTEANEHQYYTLLDGINNDISTGTMERALKLTRYFEWTSLRVVGGIDDPSAKLPEPQKAWYHALPEEGSRKVALQVGAGAKVAQRTVDRLLRNKGLFRYQRGRFEKIFF
ncbi:MAG: DUF3987 domain-containing protein, partial [Bacteroidota bacterium]